VDLPLDVEISEARSFLKAQINALVLQDRSPFFVLRKNGFKRGIDFYSTTSFIDVLLDAVCIFRRRHGRFPDLTNPERFSDKLFWSKFFGEFKTPETGNKLLNRHFIPETARHLVSCPEIVWRSTVAQLPRNEDIDAGLYYLKTNHGCNMYHRVRFPLADTPRRALEAKFSDFLKLRYGMRSGEWWYNDFVTEIFLERSVSEQPNSIAWNHFVFEGQVVLLSVFRKVADGAEATLLDPDYNQIDFQNPNRQRVSFALPSPTLRAKMNEAARLIGGQFGFARVDFLIGDDQQLYLSEITFTPGNGLTHWPDDLDFDLGRLWRIDR
jgi:hypothetical protein